MAGLGQTLHALDQAILAVFVAELAAYWPRGDGVFQRSWCVFDFIVVVLRWCLPRALCCVAFAAGFAGATPG